MNTIKTKKKSQAFIISAMFLFLLMIFIYSQETQNTYIVKSGEYNLVKNIIYETCYIGTTSNGSFIDNRYSTFKNNIYSHCQNIEKICNLTITNNTQIPPLGNYSLLNYTHYNYHLTYLTEHISYSINFTC